MQCSPLVTSHPFFPFTSEALPIKSATAGFESTTSDLKWWYFATLSCCVCWLITALLRRSCGLLVDRQRYRSKLCLISTGLKEEARHTKTFLLVWWIPDPWWCCSRRHCKWNFHLRPLRLLSTCGANSCLLSGWKWLVTRANSSYLDSANGRQMPFLLCMLHSCPTSFGVTLTATEEDTGCKPSVAAMGTSTSSARVRQTSFSVKYLHLLIPILGRLRPWSFIGRGGELMIYVGTAHDTRDASCGG